MKTCLYQNKQKFSKRGVKSTKYPEESELLEKIAEIFQHWPLLRREVIGGDIMELPGNYGKDYVTLKFRNGSQLDVVGGDGTRGLRRNGSKLKFYLQSPLLL